MGLYNLVTGRILCPRCGHEIDAEVETRLGYVHEVLHLQVGDRYPWNHPDMPSNRPEGGNGIGDGYTVCPQCHRDFFVKVIVRDDIIQRLEHDPDHRG